ncbi:MAG: (d)CMP kinase [Marinilabiliaceae bacterium]
MKNIIIAVDGHSSCGKSTVAKAVARKLGIAYIDTGAMYRAVTLYAIRHGLAKEGYIDTEGIAGALGDMGITFSFDKEMGRNTTYLNGENVEDEIRGMAVSGLVSPVSAIPAVRAKLTDWQREMGRNQSVIMDGRDIGTTVFPDADLKIFMTARPEVRARRRYDELTAKGQEANLAEILRNVEERDRQDSTRAVSPLRKADDAIVLDNSDMTREEQFDFVIERVKEIKQAHPCK